MTKIAILGGGGWGMAVAIVLSRSRKPHEIALWVHNAGLAESIRRERENKTYLPGAKLPESIRVYPQLEAALSGAQVILGAMPSANARAVYTSALPFVAAGASFVSASKGLEPSTHLRMSEVLAQVVSPKFVPRMAIALGARPETLSGLAGLGDLVLTCTGLLSRNRFVGIELGKGRSLGEILANMRMVAEGVNTAAPLLALAREHQIEMPITEQVDAILHAGKSPKDAIHDIMERPLKRE